MSTAFEELAATLRGEPAFRDKNDTPVPQTPEDIVAQCDTIYLHLRGDESVIPIARTRHELQAAVALHCKAGLEAMARTPYDRETDYAGYTLIPYRYPTQRLEFLDPAAARDLKKRYGIDPDAPDYHRQDYWLKLHDCFDIRMLSEEYPDAWGAGSYPQDEFAQKGYILGPVVRLRDIDPDDPDIDEYHQYANLRFDPANAVLIPGMTLLDMLQQHYPQLLDGSNIPKNMPHMYLMEQFGLEPLAENFRYRWLGIRREWEANHHEREGEE